MLSIGRQCELLNLNRTTYYYCSERDESYNRTLMHLLDEQFTRTPFYGVDRMTAWLRRRGHGVNPKRIRRLMRQMGLEAVYPKPRLSENGKAHRRYPYLLRELSIDHPDQVWCSDITYIRMVYGFVYLVAVMDWFSRYVLAWELSTTLETGFCVRALQQALMSSKPEIFNTDQGVQFTSAEFLDPLMAGGIRISMDGRGRVYDNIFVERLWRSVKYEEVYLREYREVKDARDGLTRYFDFYNRKRPHSALGNQTPHEVYFPQQGSFSPFVQASQTMHHIPPTFLS
jgi:putative transposase